MKFMIRFDADLGQLALNFVKIRGLSFQITALDRCSSLYTFLWLQPRCFTALGFHRFG